MFLTLHIFGPMLIPHVHRRSGGRFAWRFWAVVNVAEIDFFSTSKMVDFLKKIRYQSSKAMSNVTTIIEVIDI